MLHQAFIEYFFQFQECNDMSLLKIREKEKELFVIYVNTNFDF